MHTLKTTVYGLHLIELLITLSLIGIAATLTYPAYTRYIVYEKRTEAAGMLVRLSINLEKYYLEHLSFENVSLAALKLPEFIAKQSYQIIIQSATTKDYILLAKPLGKQADEDRKCATLTLNAYGEKGITGNGQVKDCW